MSRLTKNISDKQTYCGYEVKDCKYQQIYGFKKYSELENYVDCDLTLAIDKLGQLEDSAEKLGCPLEVREKAFNNGFYDVDGNHYFCEHYVPYLKSMHTRGISMGREKHFKLKDYKITWWLKKDRSE